MQSVVDAAPHAASYYSDAFAHGSDLASHTASSCSAKFKAKVV